MKIAPKNLLLPLFTLLLICGGAAMPFISSSLQDQQTERVVRSREFAPVNITLRQTADMTEVLQLMQKDYELFNYTGPTNLTQTEAEQTAKDVLQTINDTVMPLPLSTQTEIYTELKLAVCNNYDNIYESESSAVLWQCSFNNPQINDYSVIIDDSSEKMVKFICGTQNQAYEYVEKVTDNGAQVAVISSYIDISNSLLEKWLIFCQNYYAIEIVDMEEHLDIGIRIYGLKYQFNDSDKIYELPITILDNSLILN